MSRRLNKPIYILLLGGGLTFFLYAVIFSRSGLVVRRDLEGKIQRIETLHQDLEEANEDLRRRYNMLQDGDAALKLEAKKYLLLSDNSRILRFKESLPEEMITGAPSSSQVKKSLLTAGKSKSVDHEEGDKALTSMRALFMAGMALVTAVAAWWSYRRDAL